MTGHCFLKRTGPRFLDGDAIWANALDRDGGGAIGQDVGQLAIVAWSNGDVASTPSELLDDLLESYLDALRAADGKTPADLVVDSVTTTLAIRPGWVVDHALALAGRLSDEEWARPPPDVVGSPAGRLLPAVQNVVG